MLIIIKMSKKKEEKEKPLWMLTKQGYSLDEVVSALQKSIRRGLEEESLYWAIEMAISGYGQYLWRRLCIIVSEDIGLANLQAPVVINSLAENCKRCTKSWKDPQMLPIAHAVLYLCRSNKNREVDDYLEYLKLKIKKGFRLEVPSWAIDIHTKSGRKNILKNNLDPIEIFYRQGSQLSNEKILDGGNIYKDRLYRELDIKNE